MLWWMWCCGGCGVVVVAFPIGLKRDSLTHCVDLDDLDDWLEHGLICLCTCTVIV